MCVLPTCVVGECASVAVKDEPAFLPGFDLASHLDQVASAGLFRDGQVEARVQVVAGRLDVSPQVEIVLSHRQVPSKRPGLEGEGRMGSFEKEKQVGYDNDEDVFRISFVCI